jgi:hypothetical protein
MLYTRLGHVVAVSDSRNSVHRPWAMGNDHVRGQQRGAPTPKIVARIGIPERNGFFDHGLYTVLFAIALGILTEISRNVRASRLEQTPREKS